MRVELMQETIVSCSLFSIIKLNKLIRFFKDRIIISNINVAHNE